MLNNLFCVLGLVIHIKLDRIFIIKSIFKSICIFYIHKHVIFYHDLLCVSENST